MRFRHAPLLLLAAASLMLTAAAPATGTASSAVAASALAATPSLAGTASGTATGSAGASETVDPYERATEAIVAMTSGPQRTGSALVVAPGLILTSTHVVKFDKAGTTAIMTVDGGFAQFSVEASDTRLGLVLLRAPTVTAKPLVWGKSRELIADDGVEALGLGSGARGVLVQKGKLVSPAAATGNDLMITDIKIDPLVEGGPLVLPDGRIVGIVVARGQGEAGGDLGWAVTSEAVQDFVRSVQKKDEIAAEEASKRTFRRIIAWSVLLAILAVLVFLGWKFKKWYRRMEERETAAMAAEEAAAAAAAAEATGE